MDELTTSTLLFVIATALISLAFSTNMLGEPPRNLYDLHDTVSEADEAARSSADGTATWAHLDAPSER